MKSTLLAKAMRWWRLVALVSVVALMATLVPLSPASGQQNDNNRRVRNLQIYYDSNQGLQPGDYLSWRPARYDNTNIVDYTVQRQTRTDNNWGSWTDLGTVPQSVDPIRYDITDTQPACTDWNFRVRANWQNGTSGPWSKAWFILSPRRVPAAPNLDTTHAGTVEETSTNNVVRLTADWQQAYCQTDFEVWFRERYRGNMGNFDANWTEWELVDGGPSVGGDTEGSNIGGSPGTTSEYSLTHNFYRRGIGVDIAVRVKNRAGWSDWSYIRWTRGFRVPYGNGAWIAITKSDLR